MRLPARSLRLVAGLLLPPLAGCDAAIAGYFLPGVGRPLTGRVIDARTHLPVGGATVVAGLGSTVSDGEGRFRLFGNFNSREVSVSRAGYVAQTQGGIPIDPGRELVFELDPLFPDTSPATMRFLELSGPVVGLPSPTSPALVSLGTDHAAVSNGLYSISFRGAVPGRLLTSVLAWGSLSQAYTPGVAAAQPFHFLDFAFEVRSWALGDTVPESRQQYPVQIRQQVPIKQVRVSYGNLGGFAGVQTDVALDFGVLGFVPVARALASSQTLSVPALEGLKYVITGEARDAGGRTRSLVTLTTNDPGKATFQLLSVPKIEAPANGATQVGQRPTFRWTPVPGEVSYQVTLQEVGEAKPKWVGLTDLPEITYPGFALNDINGGALRPEKKYVWSLRVIDMLEETETPGAARALLGFEVAAPVPVRPYRVRKREAEVSEMGFAL